MLNNSDTQKEVDETEIDDGAHSMPFRNELISILEQGIETMGPDFDDKDEVEDARQAVDFLKQNQINQIDVNRHLSLLLD